MVDASAETPLHFCEKRIDPAYEWNEWSMRRKAVQIANLRKAKTVSSQTTSSHFRRENETQVYQRRRARRRASAGAPILRGTTGTSQDSGVKRRAKSAL